MALYCGNWLSGKTFLHQRIHATKINAQKSVLRTSRDLHCQSYGVPSSHIWMWELDHKEGWVPKNWCVLTMVLEKTLESPLDSKEIKPVNPKGNQPWIFTGRTDAEDEAAILWPPDAKSQLIGKDTDAGKYWGQEKKVVTEDDMIGWHHQLNGANSARWWRTGKPGVLQSVGLLRVRYDLGLKYNNWWSSG